MDKKVLGKEQVEHIAKIAHLPLSSLEIEKFTLDLSSILDYFKRLDEVSVKDVSPMGSIQGGAVPREDVVESSLSQEEVLSNSKEVHNSLFKVEAIFEE